MSDFLRGSVKLAGLAVLALSVTACTCKPHKALGKYGDAANKDVAAVDNIGDGSEISPLKDINYGFDSYALSPIAKSILNHNASIINSKNFKVEVEGHCDERGTSEYNLALGNKRAKAARDYLVNQGVSAQSLSTISWGEELPLDPAHNEAAWAKNRRAHFKVIK